MSLLAAALPARKTVEVAFALVSTVLSEHVNSIVTEPYMDEIFHIPQAQAYCRSEWSTWDPKLTTPPGIYLVSVGMSRALRYVGLPIACSNGRFLRSTNLALFFVLPHLLAAIRTALLEDERGVPTQPGKTAPPELASALDRAKAQAAPSRHGKAALQKLNDDVQRGEVIKTLVSVEAHAIASLPPLWFFAFLYYTDVGSLVVVLATYLAALKHWPILSAALGLASLLFRQTNIIWVAFVAWTVLLRDLRQLGLFAQPAEKSTFSSLHRDTSRLLGLLRHGTTWRAVSTCFAHLPVFIAFAAFLLVNGGIVLGDKSNHVAGLHFPQLLYFAAFSSFFAWPFLLRNGPAQFARSMMRFAARRRSLLGITMTTGLALLSVHRFTIFHPFVLADNRHYPFYVRKRILDVRPWARYALVPAYVASILAWWRELAAAQSVPWLVGFIGSMALTLVPSPLMEPRYFLVPYVLMRLHVSLPDAPFPAPADPPKETINTPDSGSAHDRAQRWLNASLLELAWNIVIHGVTMYLFLYRPFSNPGQPGLQRFMW